MAERRMTSKKIVDTDAFLDMPLSTQALYFHFIQNADDDGFVGNPNSIIRKIGANKNDYDLLIAKSYVIKFESGICVIKHWRIHNYIQKDRYNPTNYIGEMRTLEMKENNEYTISLNSEIKEIEIKECKKMSDARVKRIEAKKESELPYSFEYKIRYAFVGESCPICGKKMDYSNNLCKPTIQHNKPISLGGKHELDNISIICSSCNSSIQNHKETPPYNTELVKEKWECIRNVSGMDTQDRLGKVSIGKDRLGKVSLDKFSNELTEEQIDNMTNEEYAEYLERGIQNEKGN